MTFIIEPVTNAAMADAADRVREEVFGREWNKSLPPLTSDPAETLTLIARTESGAQPIAALTVLDTTTQSELHKRFALPFENGIRVARYTRLAVLKPYRGLNIPLQFILEARRRFIATANIGYTWLLFDAERATSSTICSQLGFHSSEETFRTEHGLSRVLWRSESNPGACLRDEDAQRFLHNSRRRTQHIPASARPLVSLPSPDKWLTQGLAQWLMNQNHSEAYATRRAY
jgi:GNAT superfamily N-acetyltransferase